MLYLHSVVKGKIVHDKHGMYALRRLFCCGKLSQYPPVIGEDDQSILEKFVVTMYDRYSATDSIDVARLELLSRKQRSYGSIPPTQAVLIQHNKRAAYQAGCIWCQGTICQMETNGPAE